MKYMLLIYPRLGLLEGLSDEERTALFADVDAVMAELTASGELVGGEGLADPSGTRTVRQRGGQVAVTDGPFIEGKEQFGGYLIVDCDSIERATEIAAGWPDIKLGGALEVRAIMHDGGSEM